MRRLHPAAADAARSKISESPFAAHADHILHHAEPLLRLDRARSANTPCGSWLGGTPALPVDVEWPTWDPTTHVMKSIAGRERAIAEYQYRDKIIFRDGRSITRPDPRLLWQKMITRLQGYVSHIPRPLHFLAQIDLSEAGDAAASVELPSRGTLWFFCDADLYYPSNERSWRVIYRDIGHEKLKPQQTPAGISSFRQTMVVPRPGLSLNSEAKPPVSTARLERAWTELRWNLIGKGPLHTLGGGLTDPKWCRPRVQSLTTEKTDKPTPEEWKQIERDAADLNCLLYLATDDSDIGPSWKWGDMGAMTFWLRANAWERRAFNEARAYMDTT